MAKLDANGNMVKDGQVTPDGYAVNTSRSVYLHAPTDTDPARLVPPQTMPHIGDRLDAKGISWKWYSGGYDDAMAGHPDARFQYHHQPLQYFQDLAPGTPAQKAHLQDYKDLVRDIQQNTLPQVVFYKPIGQFNQHPGYTNVTDGDGHLAELVADAAEESRLSGHADHHHLGREWRAVGPRAAAAARQVGSRHAHPADRRRSDSEARLCRPHAVRFRLDPAHDRGSLRRSSR